MIAAALLVGIMAPPDKKTEIDKENSSGDQGDESNREH